MDSTDVLQYNGKIVVVLMLTVFILAWIFSSKFKSAWQLLRDSEMIFRKRPIFIVPIIFVWFFFAAVTIYLTYFNDFSGINIYWMFFWIFLIIMIFAFLISFSALVVLEMIEQLEFGNEIDLYKALNEAIRKDLVKTIPITIIWTVVWFLLTIIESFFRKDDKKENKEFNLENTAKTLAGGDEKFSLSGEIFRLIQKGLRMVIFLILPAIAWENYSTVQAIKRGIFITKSNFMNFLSNLIVSDLAGILIFLPPGIILYLSSEIEMTFPSYVWVGVILYSAIAWSFYLYIEQMITALFYLWYMKWEKKTKEAILSDEAVPSIESIKKPSLLDEIYELRNNYL